MNPSHYVVPLLFVALVVWRMYSRLRRNIGRQALQPKRMVVRIVIFAVVTCGLAAYSFSLQNPRLLLGLGVGLALGLPLAWLGLRLTQFEATPEGRFYTPHSSIGIALTILFVGRLVYRVMLISTNINAPTQRPAFLQSALSFFVYGLLAGYYLAYYIGVLVRSRAPTS
jgi:cytochrome b561